jgi:sugar-specific transcriptional regulator TrmB
MFSLKKGPKARDIVKTLRMPKQQVYIVLKNLQSKGIINATLERPASFSVVPFEKVLDLFVKAKMEEAQQIAQGKADVLSDWQSLAIGETVDTSPKFTVLEGRNYIYSKLEQMIKETKNQFLIISTVAWLVRADQFGLLDAAFNHANKSKAQIRFLTELSDQNTSAMKNLLKRLPRNENSFEGRVPELGLKLFTRIMIRDDEEAVFFITLEEDKTQDDKTESCLWTNSKALVQSFSAFFEDLWRQVNRRKQDRCNRKPKIKSEIMFNARCGD